MIKITHLVNRGHEDCTLKIDVIEEKYNARYVGQMTIRNSAGQWAESLVEVFYQPVKPHPDYSHYFAIFSREGVVYITSAQSAVEGVITGIQANDGEIIYSRYRHDMRYSQDKSVWIDGGRDYTRSSGGGRFVNLKVIHGDWYELDAQEVQAEAI